MSFKWPHIPGLVNLSPVVCKASVLGLEERGTAARPMNSNFKANVQAYAGIYHIALHSWAPNLKGRAVKMPSSFLKAFADLESFSPLWIITPSETTQLQLLFRRLSQVQSTCMCIFAYHVFLLSLLVWLYLCILFPFQQSTLHSLIYQNGLDNYVWARQSAWQSPFWEGAMPQWYREHVLHVEGPTFNHWHL